MKDHKRRYLCIIPIIGTFWQGSLKVMSNRSSSIGTVFLNRSDTFFWNSRNIVYTVTTIVTTACWSIRNLLHVCKRTQNISFMLQSIVSVNWPMPPKCFCLHVCHTDQFFFLISYHGNICCSFHSMLYKNLISCFFCFFWQTAFSTTRECQFRVERFLLVQKWYRLCWAKPRYMISNVVDWQDCDSCFITMVSRVVKRWKCSGTKNYGKFPYIFPPLCNLNVKPFANLDIATIPYQIFME